jgi:hypothetical protein
MYKEIFLEYDMEKYLKETSICHEEISIKYTNGGISTNRMNYGFETTKVADLSEFLIEKLGPDRYNKVVRHFRREIREPRKDEYMMIGVCEGAFEIYIEYGVGGKSYDIQKDVEFMYFAQKPDDFGTVYKYLENVLPDPLFDMLNRVLPERKCDTLYAKHSPLHKCVYLFRPKIFPQVKFIKELLMSAAKVVNMKRVELDDNLYLSYIAIGITHDNSPELAYYFRRERSQRVVKPAGSL